MSIKNSLKIVETINLEKIKSDLKTLIIFARNFVLRLRFLLQDTFYVKSDENSCDTIYEI